MFEDIGVMSDETVCVNRKSLFSLSDSVVTKINLS